jgi:thiamine biosynthesis lipoprotein
VEDLASFHKPSKLSEVNDHAGEGPFKPDPELLALIKESLRVADRSGGAFDPTIGPLSRLWNFSGGEPRLPEESEIAQALPKVGWQKVKIDETAGTIELPERGMALDLGGIAKGYALHRAAAVIRRLGVRNALVNAGGDILVVGEKAPGRPWRIGIQDPRDPRGIAAVVDLRDRVILTSGDYERCFIKDGKRYHHILNPRTGYPAEGTQSVTIIAPEGVTADGTSTAVFVLGPEEGLKYIESVPEVQGMLIDSSGRVRMSSAAESVFELRR